MIPDGHEENVTSFRIANLKLSADTASAIQSEFTERYPMLLFGYYSRHCLAYCKQTAEDCTIVYDHNPSKEVYFQS